MDGNFEKQEFSDLVKLSLWCAEMAGNDRPSMPQVVQALRDCGNGQMESQEFSPKSDVKRNSIPDITKFASGPNHEKDTTHLLFSTPTSLSSSTSQSTNNGVSNHLLSSSSNPRMIEISEIFSNILPKWLNHELCTKDCSMYVTSCFYLLILIFTYGQALANEIHTFSPCG